jgi:trimethylamine--corrinoid protein Co-methyltransferase
MQSSPYHVLSPTEIQTIHQHSLQILEDVGIKVELKKMRDLLRDMGCPVDESSKIVKFKADMVETYRQKAPREFTICGADPTRQWPMHPEARIFGGLGTLVNIYDMDTGKYRPTTFQDQVDHIILFDNLDHIVSNQMDIWPHDIPMHTIHAEAIRAWYLNCHKSFGMGAYGVMATMDMMDMVELVMGGADQVRNQHPFLTIVSIQSPLSTAQIQLEGLMILAERGQPAIMSPEAMAGTTAPVTLAGLMVQHNAEVLSHIVMAQAVKPGAPVLYGSVSTIAEMRRGTVALGAVETGIISAASSQMAHFYNLPCRAVAGTTEAKTLDMQCAMERYGSMMQTAQGGANYITCVGTTESSMAGAHELACIDNEMIGMVERAIRGIEVNDDNLALDVIRRVGPDGNYLMEEHTQMHFRKEHFIPKLADRDKRDIWENNGSKEMKDKARDQAMAILAKHQPREIDPKLVQEIDRFVDLVKNRSLDDFYAAEWEA